MEFVYQNCTTESVCCCMHESYLPPSYSCEDMHTVEPPTTDSLYYGNLHNADKKLWSGLLYIATSV